MNDRAELLKHVDTYVTGRGTLKSMTEQGRNTFMLVDDVTVRVGSKSIKIDHLNLGRFPWHSWTTDGFKIGGEIVFHGPIQMYSSEKFGKRDKVGIPRLTWAKAV